jgi:hypothetical protein
MKAAGLKNWVIKTRLLAFPKQASTRTFGGKARRMSIQQHRKFLHAKRPPPIRGT